MDSEIVGKSAKTKAHNGINQILNNVFKSYRSVFAKKGISLEHKGALCSNFSDIFRTYHC